MNIKKIVTDIIKDGSGMIYTDAGNGSGGPGFADPETLAEMLDLGIFDDAVVVDFDEQLAKDSFASLVDYDPDTDWIQVEFGWCDKTQNNPYHQIGWLWEA